MDWDHAGQVGGEKKTVLCNSLTFKIYILHIKIRAAISGRGFHTTGKKYGHVVITMAYCI